MREHSTTRISRWRRPLDRLLVLTNDRYRFLSGGIYPAWIRTGCLPNDEIPVFYYHRIGSARFQRQLAFLAKNGYQTLTADDYYDVVTSRRLQKFPAVVLTFDDGLQELYETVYPLLRRYGMKAVAYVVPGWVGSPGIVSWDQLREMHESGLVDVQSHSMNHKAIYVDSEIRDFFPSGRFAASRYLYPLDAQGAGISAYFDGMPLYSAASRLSDARRWIPLGVAERLCFAVTQRLSEVGPLSTAGRWKATLRAEVRRARMEQDTPGIEESVADQRAAIATEIDASKHAIEEQLPGKQVRHFAYPWHEGGYSSARAVRDAGFLTCAGGLEPHPSIRALMTLVPVRRVSLDFLECLPGTGKKSFPAVVLSKLIRSGIARGKSFEERQG